MIILGLASVSNMIPWHTDQRKGKVWNKAKTMHIAIATGLVSWGSYTLES